MIQQKQRSSEPQDDGAELDPIQQLLMADAEEEARGPDQSPKSEHENELTTFSEDKDNDNNKAGTANKLTKQSSSGAKQKAKV